MHQYCTNERYYRLFSAPSLSCNPGLIFLLHDKDSSPEIVLNHSFCEGIAEACNCKLVVPNGLNGTWNLKRDDAYLDDLYKRFCKNIQRFFFIGHGLGASFACRLLKEEKWAVRLAGIVNYAGGTKTEVPDYDCDYRVLSIVNAFDSDQNWARHRDTVRKFTELGIEVRVAHPLGHADGHSWDEEINFSIVEWIGQSDCSVEVHEE